MTKVRVYTSQGIHMVDFDSMESFEAWLVANNKNAADYRTEVIDA
jgi:hypothetical protein